MNFLTDVASNKWTEFMHLSDDELNSLLDDSDRLEDMHNGFLASQEKHLRALGDVRGAACDVAAGFGLTMNGYNDVRDPSLGFLVTDRRKTKTTFSIKSLSPSDVADAYVAKVKIFYPNDWKYIVNLLAWTLENSYRDLLLDRCEDCVFNG